LGVERLREAGPIAVGAVLAALTDSERSAAERQSLVANLGKLDRSAVPPLIAALDAPDRMIAADAADALGSIGDARAVPFLIEAAVRSDAGALGVSARRAIERLTGRSLDSLSRSPRQFLLDEALRYHRGHVSFPAETVTLWRWTDGGLASEATKSADAATELGVRFARAAAALEPKSNDAQVVLLSLLLEAAARKSDPFQLPKDDADGVFASALASGPVVLSGVLNGAVREGHGLLATAAALALGRVSDTSAFTESGTMHPLVAALSASDQRAQLAAARAIVELAPDRPFIGSSRVIPTLARFVAADSSPGAVVIDGNQSRGGHVAGMLGGMGFDAVVTATGPEGFQRAAETADVELICLEPEALQGPWRAGDVIANMRADSRTSTIPILMLASLKERERLRPLYEGSPRVAFLVVPTDNDLLKKELERELSRMKVERIAPIERKKLAQAGIDLLMQIAARGGVLSRELGGATSALIEALRDPELAGSAARVLAEVRSIDAQRALADVVVDPSRSSDLRILAADGLAASVRRSGGKLTSAQERKLLETLAAESGNAPFRSAISAVIGALRPREAPGGKSTQSPDATTSSVGA
jgi:PleD family two-component response regulator